MEKRKRTKEHLDAIRGCIFGGAVGDALGYSVEFLQEDILFSKYGPKGITEYDRDPASGKALISDDTQMTLFTANGLLVGDTRGSLRGVQGEPRFYVAKAYLDWLKTQESSINVVNRHECYGIDRGYSWLLDVPELYNRRAPGGTCLSALEREKNGERFEDYIEAKRNNSKGCGGIMRVAPIAVNYTCEKWLSIEQIDKEGAQLAAITHGHSLGYMPAAVLTHIINRIVFPPDGISMTLKEIVLEARDTIAKIFEGDSHLPELNGIIDQAVRLAEHGSANDLENIHELGEGWVGEEALGIALYCALKYHDNFRAGIIAAVNHKGDSDSTGAVTGNILGALLGYKAIPDSWKKDLELSDVILEIADDLCYGCQTLENRYNVDPDWESKYIHMKHPVKKNNYVFFWKDNGKNGYLSNWYQCKFVIDDFEYLHVEQYMMAQKAKLFHDSARYTAILRATDQQECKALGKLVSHFDSATWKSARYEIVKAGNRAKYEQNPYLKTALLDTGDAILAEASPKDTIWGIGLDAKDASVIDVDKWPGENLLGKILMELREEFSKEAPHKTEIKLLQGDITKITDVEAIVNAANKSLLVGGGVNGAIHRAAGSGLLAECRTLHGCETGESKLTKAYKLPCTFVIHTVGPVWDGGKRNEAKLLADCYRNSLKLAVEHGIRSLAFPSISTGAFSYPVEAAAKIAISTVNEFIKRNPGKLDLVEWVLFNQKTFDAYEKEYKSYEAKSVTPVSVNTNEYELKEVGDGQAEIVRYLGFEQEEMVIPSKINGKSIIKIGNEAFYSCSGIKKLTISPGIKTIGVRAFVGCNQLHEVIIGEGTEIIEDMAFMGCRRLMKIDLPTSLKKLTNANGSFYDGHHIVGAFARTGLYYVKLPECIHTIPASLFWGCKHLMHIDLPDNLLRIGEKAFAGCRIESLKLPLTVVDIDSDAFVNCSKLEILQLNEGLEHIGENAFKGCGFSKVIIPSSVINIGGGAFDHEVTLCCYSGTKGVEYARLHNYKLEKA